MVIAKQTLLLISVMRSGMLFISAWFYTLPGFAQGEYYGGAGGFGFNSTNVGRVVNLLDLNGQSLLRKYEPDISGSPFLNNTWAAAKITLPNGKEIGPFLVKLNIESNQLYFFDSSGKELVASEGAVRKIEFINYYSKDSIRYIFKNGYPVIDKQNENFFYQVLTEGKIQLLVKKIKYLRTSKDAYTSEVSKEFVDEGNVKYLYDGVTIQELRADKNLILSYMKDKMEAINKFVAENKTNFRKTSDLIKLFTYYNGLKD